MVLASASPARLAVLRAAGVEPVVRVSGVDEDAVAASLVDPTPDELVVALAEAKARAVLPAVAAEHRDAVVVGCDSMLLHGGELVGKPGTVERARKRWAAVAGGTGVLLTGHAVLRTGGGAATGTERTTVRFGQPSERELVAYLATGEPLAVAGAFTLDGLGAPFVRRVEGDPAAVVGLSLTLLRQQLAKRGLAITDLWKR